MTRTLSSAEIEILASIVNSLDDAVFSQDKHGIITSWNHGAEKLFGYSESEAIGKSITLIDPAHPEEIKRFIKNSRELKKTEHYETVRIRKNGEKIDILLTLYPLYDVSARLIGSASVARDITLHKQLQVDRSFLASIVDSTSDAVLTKTLDGIILSWNQGAERIYGYKPEEVIGRPVTMLTAPFNQEEIPRIMERLRRGERIETYETQRMKKDKTIIQVSLTVSPVWDETGKIVAASAIARDITDQKKAEDLIRKQLEEKDVLVQEVHHRVKNNLQVLSSLMELSSRNVGSTETKSVFKETIQRIRAMALVHESMYRSDGFAGVQFKEYLQNLCEMLIHAYTDNLGKITLHITGEAGYLKLNLALPLGLIFNELLTNSIIHAFKSEQGNILIDLHEENSVLSIAVQDDGTGLPQEIDPLTSNTFGFRIVRMLTEQLGGKLQVNREKGTMFRLSLPIK
jgi:PAS domain S-box-containing protein